MTDRAVDDAAKRIRHCPCEVSDPGGTCVSISPHVYVPCATGIMYLRQGDVAPSHDMTSQDMPRGEGGTHSKSGSYVGRSSTRTPHPHPLAKEGCLAAEPAGGSWTVFSSQKLPWNQGFVLAQGHGRLRTMETTRWGMYALSFLTVKHMTKEHQSTEVQQTGLQCTCKRAWNGLMSTSTMKTQFCAIKKVASRKVLWNRGGVLVHGGSCARWFLGKGGVGRCGNT